METNIIEMIQSITGSTRNLDTLWNLLAFEKASIRHAIRKIKGD